MDDLGRWRTFRAMRVCGNAWRATAELVADPTGGIAPGTLVEVQELASIREILTLGCLRMVSSKYAALAAAMERLRLFEMANTSNILVQVLETGIKAQPAFTHPTAQVSTPNMPLSVPLAPAAPVPSPAYWKYNGELYPGEPGGLGLLALLHSKK